MISAAQAQAQALVKVQPKMPGGPIFIEMGDSPDTRVSLGPYDNPAVVREEAERLRTLLTRLIEQPAPAAPQAKAS